MKKKLLIIPLLLAGVLLFAACGGVSPSLNLNNSTFMDAPSIAYEDDADGCNRKEVLEYSVRIDPDYTYNSVLGNKPRLDAEETRGTVTYTLRWKYGSSQMFYLESVMTLNGVYKLADGSYTSEPFTDTVIRRVAFKGASEAFAPTSSETIFDIHDVYSHAIDKKTSEWRLMRLRYRTTVTYDAAANRADATLNAINEETGEYTEPMPLNPALEGNTTVRPTTGTYKKLSKNTPYFDNNQLFYVARAMDSVATGTMAAVAVKVPSMLDDPKSFSKISISSSAADKNDTVNKTFIYSLTDEAATKVTKTGARVYFQLSANQSGKPITAYYSTVASKRATGDDIYFKYMIRMVQEQMLYELQKINDEYVTSDPETPEE